ncbi:MAG: hypothetical protein UH850_07800 [Paludibacteraceae bacterium]|nr:hypothetical protein [Paludibacteraceae bacterium]
MKCIIEQMGNPSRTSEEIKKECMLFLTHTDFTDGDCEIIKDYEITIDVTTRAFLTEMSSEKTHYAFFLLNKKDGLYVIYDFLVSVIDSRIVDQEYIAKRICQPLFTRLKMNNGDKDVYIRILGYSQDDYYKIIREDNIKEISVEIAKLICKK